MLKRSHNKRPLREPSRRPRASSPAERDEGQHVERADARMGAAMRAQIDALDRDARRAPPPPPDTASPLAEKREDAAMMHRIAGAVGQRRARVLDRAGHRIEHFRIAPFGNVGHAFEEFHPLTRALRRSLRRCRGRSSCRRLRGASARGRRDHVREAEFLRFGDAARALRDGAHLARQPDLAEGGRARLQRNAAKRRGDRERDTQVGGGFVDA